MKTAILSIAVALSFLAAPAFAADKHVKVAEATPVCTGASSLFDVLGDKCKLVKGSMIYGDIASLSDLSDLGSVAGSAGGGSAISGF